MYTKHIRLHTGFKGEIASLLTIISMLVIGAGLLFGTQVSRTLSPINVDPKAQTIDNNMQANALVTPVKNLLTAPVSAHNEVCFPAGRVAGIAGTLTFADPFCRSNTFPEKFTIDALANANIPNDSTDPANTTRERIFRLALTKDDKNAIVGTTNPYIDIATTPSSNPASSDNPVSVNVYGAVCMLEESIQNARTLNFRNTEIYMSAFGVRKYQDDLDQIGIVEQDFAYAKAGLIKSAEFNRGTFVPFVSNSPICTYRLNSEGTMTFKNKDNPLVFWINIEQSSLISHLRSKLASNTDGSRFFNTEACQIYMHIKNDGATSRSNSVKDTYNVVPLDLKSLIGQDASQEFCPPNTPTPTHGDPTSSPTPTPEPSHTPTATPTPQPRLAACFEECTSNAQCGLGKDNKKLNCLEVTTLAGGGDQRHDPFGISESGQPATGQTVIGTCNLNSGACKCLPSRCLDGSQDCSTSLTACEARLTPTIVLTTPTETPTPSPTIPPQACVFKSLALVHECVSIDPATGGCAKNTQGQLMTKPLTNIQNSPNYPLPIVGEAINNLAWGMLNDHQIGGGRYNSNLTSTADDNKLPPVRIMNYAPQGSAKIIDLMQKYRVFSPLFANTTYTAIEVFDSVDLPAGQNPLTAKVRIGSKVASDPVFGPEQYDNFTDASVNLYLDESQYEVLEKDGKAIYSCTNDLKGIFAGKAACNLSAYNTGADPKIIDGLTVGCGQTIEYGWTLQKCERNYDYIFAIDTSSSMTFPDPLLGSSKLAGVKSNVSSFIDQVSLSKYNARFGLVTFNKTATKVITEPISDVTAVKSQITNLTTGEGTCFECAIDAVREMATARKDKSRSVVVIFLSDGLPNRYVGQQAPIDYNPTASIETSVRNLKPQVKDIVSIGYGDTSKNLSQADAQLFDIIKKIASKPEFAFSTKSDLSGNQNLNTVFNDVLAQIDPCTRRQNNFAEIVRSKDVNGDGIVNTVDLFLIYEKYFTKGDRKEDINKDGVVNGLDVSLMFGDIGTIVPNTPAVTN